MTEKDKMREAEICLRAKRTSCRRLFTIAANQFDEIHSAVRTDKYIHIQYEQVVEKAERLFTTDEKLEILCKFSNEDYESSEEYRDKFSAIRSTYTRKYGR